MAHDGSEGGQGCCRCQIPFPAVGNFHVEFKPIDWDGTDGGCCIQGHYDVPHQIDVATNRPYDGPLCQHELDYLRGVPGRDFHWSWRFLVTPALVAVSSEPAPEASAPEDQVPEGAPPV